MKQALHLFIAIVGYSVVLVTMTWLFPRYYPWCEHCKQLKKKKECD